MAASMHGPRPTGSALGTLRPSHRSRRVEAQADGLSWADEDDGYSQDSMAGCCAYGWVLHKPEGGSRWIHAGACRGPEDGGRYDSCGTAPGPARQDKTRQACWAQQVRAGWLGGAVICEM